MRPALTWLAVLLLLAGCKAADVLPGGSEPQRAIQGAVVQILGLRADFNRFAILNGQAMEVEAKGDAVSAGRIRAVMAALIDDSKQARLAYRGRIIDAARAYAPDTLKAALDAVVAHYTEDQALTLVAPARLFVDQTLTYQKEGTDRFEEWYAELLR